MSRSVLPCLLQSLFHIKDLIRASNHFRYRSVSLGAGGRGWWKMCSCIYIQNRFLMLQHQSLSHQSLLASYSGLTVGAEKGPACRRQAPGSDLVSCLLCQHGHSNELCQQGRPAEISPQQCPVAEPDVPGIAGSPLPQGSFMQLPGFPFTCMLKQLSCRSFQYALPLMCIRQQIEGPNALCLVPRHCSSCHKSEHILSVADDAKCVGFWTLILSSYHLAESHNGLGSNDTLRHKCGFLPGVAEHSQHCLLFVSAQI